MSATSKELLKLTGRYCPKADFAELMKRKSLDGSNRLFIYTRLDPTFGRLSAGRSSDGWDMENRRRSLSEGAAA
jgi:hypothetical protein